MHRSAIPLAALCCALLGTEPAAAQPLSATDIFDRAEQAAAGRARPDFIEYTQYAAFIRRGRVRAQTDRIILRTADGKTNVTPADGSNAETHVDDRPLVFPTSTFGLVERGAGGSSLFDGRPEAPPGPAVIGRVRATSRRYDVTLAGTEQLAGASVFHLVLVPRFDPSRNRIRALYVDTVTFQPRRIVIEYFAARGPVRSRPTVTFDYARIGDAWVIAHAAMDFVLRMAFVAYGGSGELRISDVRFPPVEPDWLFDRAALAAHRPTPSATAAPAGTR